MDPSEKKDCQKMGAFAVDPSDRKHWDALWDLRFILSWFYMIAIGVGSLVVLTIMIRRLSRDFGNEVGLLLEDYLLCSPEKWTEFGKETYRLALVIERLIFNDLTDDLVKQNPMLLSRSNLKNKQVNMYCCRYLFSFNFIFES